MKIFYFLCLAIFFTGSLSAQQTPLPFLRVSPQASVSQNIATFAKITIDYSRPAVNNREVWGKLVPYGLAPNNFGNGKAMPWRAGANENTVLTLSHNTQIEGQNVPAGKYSIHFIIMEDHIIFILNRDINGWGSFFYEQEKDIMRAKVQWRDAPFIERLSFGFEEITTNSATAYLHWGKKKIPFKIKVNDKKVVMETYTQRLSGLSGFNHAAYSTAANYAVQNKTHYEQAMLWIDKALGMNGGNNFTNIAVKANLLKLKGQNQQAEKMIADAIGTATEAEINAYGYTFVFSQKPNLDEAIRIFKMNVKNHPESWNVYDSLGEAYAKKGNKNLARKNYEIALQKAPSNQKQRIEGIIKNL